MTAEARRVGVPGEGVRGGRVFGADVRPVDLELHAGHADGVGRVGGDGHRRARDSRPGDKHYHWEQRGVPFRFEVGPRDVDAGTLVLKSRLGAGAKEIIKLDDMTSPRWLQEKLDAAHAALFEKAKKFRDESIRRAATYDEMKKIIAEQGGFVRCYFIPDRGNEAKIKEETKATVRCIPFDQPPQPGKCIYTGRETTTEVLFAQAY